MSDQPICVRGGKVEAVFLDMDGVLTDFYGACMQQFGKHPRSRFQPFPQPWEIWNLLGVTEQEFWRRCSGHKFWANLQWTEFGIDLLKVVEMNVPNDKVYLLSHPSRDQGSYSGKYAWICDHMPNYRGRLILTGHKHLLGRAGHILIDDSESNINNFMAGGGCGLLIPQVWNRLHKHADTPFLHGVDQFLTEHEYAE